LKENFEIHFGFTQTLAKRLRFKSVISKEISSYGPLHRISTLLKEYKKNHGITSVQFHKIDLTRQQIADMTGLRVETVIRTIRQMQEDGLVKIEKGKVYC
jgi:CRP-like cAMP-binding protein